ncbi:MULTISPECIES: site-specific DNA-methyltransferase [unclassified Microbacterium]|uniref:site-specific DNA-methyltransferase n=1 Tax=unclassified Microbacterium TaxID=2609290 RepID=UPI00214B26F0|nr:MULTISPECIES: site-specific DNA-methyltransferase [unclassified Microbacterium]MCR2811125.1 site-specific DNA-methyltransferase [Microbacterium sp. zg.B185]WIM20761.1 site-specific DNA-methyltransferase [Microbacterium sp. zg-B185]
MLPPRGSTARGDQRLWRVESIAGEVAEVALLDSAESETATVPVDDLVLVAEFRDRIYPGLRPDGAVKRGGGKPFHTVISGENFHVLKQLTFTHAKAVDAIYIDPPYNTGARDWRYNNDYVEGDDLYRHSKWLAFIERRLKIAKRLLNPKDSVLIVTIDEKEYLRLGLLLEQTFPEAEIQMVSTVTNRKGSARAGGFSRVDEYLYYVRLGTAEIVPTSIDVIGLGSGISKERLPDIWNQLMRRGSGSARSDRPALFYPIYVDPVRRTIARIGSPLPLDQHRSTAPSVSGLDTVLPMRSNGADGRWSVGPDALQKLVERGYAKVGTKSRATGLWTINYVIAGDIQKVDMSVTQSRSGPSAWKRRRTRSVTVT